MEAKESKREKEKKSTVFSLPPFLPYVIDNDTARSEWTLRKKRRRRKKENTNALCATSTFFASFFANSAAEIMVYP
jgi:hypothetical protein